MALRSADLTPSGVGVIANSPFPRQQQPVNDSADGRESLAGEERQDRFEKPAARDGEFYIDSADCVIRVDNTLFKVSVMLLKFQLSARWTSILLSSRSCHTHV